MMDFFFSLIVSQMFGLLVISAEYDFEVFPVEKCPMSKENWDKKSNQRGCNKTHGYHCVPNKDLTSLIEFCYPKGVRVPFEAGNCLELAGRGTLNQVPCKKTFSSGCPDDFYFSSHLFEYPKCLAINTDLRCFDADFECIYSRLFQSRTSKLNQTSTENYGVEVVDNPRENVSNDSKSSETIALVIVILMLIPTVILGIIFWRKWKIADRGSYRKHTDEEALLLIEGQLPDNTDSWLEKYNFKKNMDTLGHDLRMLHDAIVQGNEQEFEHLLLNLSINKSLLEKRNHRGYNALHLAARGGKLKVFNKILSFSVDVKSTAIDGTNCLHIAAFNGSYQICKFLLENHKDMFVAKDRYNMNPAHWAALGGQDIILSLMMDNDCNVSEKTPKYEENLILFACMSESLSVCKFVKSRKEIDHLLHAVNSEGWNSIQYAAKSGNIDVFKFLVENNVNIKNISRKTGKNCLQTACEKGNMEVCKYIIEKAPDLINEHDKYGLHVGHFIAKSGDTEILRLLIKEIKNNNRKCRLEQGSADNINILHIACRHARYDMCVAIADIYPQLINEITEKGWNAALFITEKSGAEKERIACLVHLEKHKLNVYHVSRSGKTILYNACANRSTNLVKFLLKCYPDLLKIEKSMNARKAARSKEIEKIFEQHMADNLNSNAM